ncbi:MAG: transposase, partial [Planctomycetes bacterium]|nr:transposase [Planctomycetota bacterium]
MVRIQSPRHYLPHESAPSRRWDRPCGRHWCHRLLGHRIRPTGPGNIVGLLRQADVDLGKGATVPDVCRRLGISQQTYYRWRTKFGRLDPKMAKQLQELQGELQAQEAGGGPGPDRGTQRYRPRKVDGDRELLGVVRKIVETFPRHGSDRTHRGRPHGGLKWLTPAAFVAGLDDTAFGPSRRRRVVCFRSGLCPPSD